MIDTRRLIEVLDYLVAKNIIHAGQRQDVINRGGEQARHILLDKRADMRRLMGRKRISYKLSAIELVASFRFKHRQDPEQLVDEELITRMVAQKMDIPFVILDPLKLDYQTVTSSFGGPFAERHHVIAVEETDTQLTLAVADP